MDQLPAAIELWESKVSDFEVAGRQTLGPTLRMFGLMQLLPTDLESDLIKLRHQLTNYVRCRSWVLDQVATRLKGTRPELNGLEEETFK